MRVLGRRTRVVIVCVAMAVAGTIVATPASAGVPGTERAVTIVLRANDPAALDRLAGQSGPLTASRWAALDHALPSASVRRQVEDQLRAQGFTITGASSWIVNATAPAAVVASLFGSAATLTGLLGKIPATLAPVVASVFEDGVGGRLVRPYALTGKNFRDAYTSAALTRAGVAPYDGSYRGPRPTIATIQFSGWNRNDLAVFARRNRLPFDDSTLTEVSVNGVQVGTSDGDGAIEVALDQEALLATSPHARQRAYIAPNDNSGFIDSFSRVLDDVRRGDHQITALSVSWGLCEGSSGPVLSAANQILKSLTAAGVTVFAASGDNGAYDCTGLLGLGSAQGVDFPASSPYVVGVGGTALRPAPGGPNDGRNWRETAWSCSSASACSGGLLGLTPGQGGSGGGQSAVFAKPSYQARVAGSGRMVPDIAGVADPVNGMTIYTSQDSHGWLTVGGTSLASPVQAALLTNMLAAHGLTRGVGNIHRALYSAAAQAGSFRDITSGDNGAYAAGPGYDAVTGLGAPLWPAIGRRIFGVSRVPPRITWSAPGHATTRRVLLRWTSGRAGFLTSVTVRNRAGAVLLRRPTAAPQGHFGFRGRVGQRYVATVTVTDRSHRITIPRNYAFVLRR